MVRRGLGARLGLWAVFLGLSACTVDLDVDVEAVFPVGFRAVDASDLRFVRVTAEGPGLSGYTFVEAIERRASPKTPIPRVSGLEVGISWHEALASGAMNPEIAWVGWSAPVDMGPEKGHLRVPVLVAPVDTLVPATVWATGLPSELNLPRREAALAVLSGPKGPEILIAGGLDLSDTPIQSAERFVANTGAFERFASLPAECPKGRMWGHAVGTKLWLAGDDRACLLSVDLKDAARPLKLIKAETMLAPSGSRGSRLGYAPAGDGFWVFGASEPLEFHGDSQDPRRFAGLVADAMLVLDGDRLLVADGDRLRLVSLLPEGTAGGAGFRELSTLQLKSPVLGLSETPGGAAVLGEAGRFSRVTITDAALALACESEAPEARPGVLFRQLGDRYLAISGLNAHSVKRLETGCPAFSAWSRLGISVQEGARWVSFADRHQERLFLLGGKNQDGRQEGPRVYTARPPPVPRF